MRQIKFRTWEKKSLVMRFWEYLKGIDYTHQFALFEDDSFVFMQFTGLLDKNGKEIYEGDYFMWGVHKCEIVWEKDGFGAKNEQGSIFGLYSITQHGEVVGNIYHP